MTGALQLVELLLVKSPTVYKASLRKEGVLHEVSRIAVMELKVTLKPAPSPAEPSSSTTENGDSIPPPKVKTSSIPSDPQDAYVIRSRLIKIKYLMSTTEGAGDAGFDTLKGQIITLGKGNASEDEIRKTLQEIAGKFSNLETGISSFELLKGGLVEGLLSFSTNEGSGGMGTPFLRDVGTLTHINSRHREERGVDTRSLFCALWLRISWVANAYGKPGEEATGELDEDGKLRGCLGIAWIDGWWVLPYTVLNHSLNPW